MTRRRLISLIAFAALIVLLLAGGISVRNALLGRLKREIQSVFNYSRIRLSAFPPGVVFEDVRSVSLSPYFSAGRVAVRMSLWALVSREKPLTVFIDRPVLRISDITSGGKKDKTKPFFPFPFDIEKGLINGGEIYYRGKERSFLAKGVRAFLRQEGEQFSFQAESDENTFLFDELSRPLEGKVKIALDGRGKNIVVKRVAFEGHDFYIKAAGTLTDPLNPEAELRVSFRIETPLLADALNLPFSWGGKARGEGFVRKTKEGISFQADVTSEALGLNSMLLESVSGRVGFSDKEGGWVDLAVRKSPAPGGRLRLKFRKGVLRGTVQGLPLDPVMEYVAIPWPVKSFAWGSFSIVNRRLEADAEFRDADLTARSGKYPFNGRVRLSWDGGRKIEFSSDSLSSGFALVEVDGKVVLGENVDVLIRGDVGDVRQAREFTSIILAKEFVFPEIRGGGEATLFINGDIRSPRVKGEFSFSPAGFDRFEAAAVSGSAEVFRGSFFGGFRVEDPFLNGKINLLVSPDGLDAEFQLQDGDVDKILSGLNISFPLRGRGSGNFQVREKNGNFEVAGGFSTRRAELAGLTLNDLSGRLEWKEGTLLVSGLKGSLYGGAVAGSVQYGTLMQEYDLDLKGEAVDLSNFAAGLAGKLLFELKGQGMLGQNQALGVFEISGLNYSPFAEMEARGKVEVQFTENRLLLGLRGNFHPGENEFKADLRIPLAGKRFSADFKGSFTNFDLFLPWKGAKGKVNYLGEVAGTDSVPRVSCAIDFQGPLFPFPKFAHALTDYSGLIFVQNGKASVRSFQGKMGGGDVQGSGELVLGRGGVEKFDLSVEGKNLLLSPMERTRALADGSLRFIKEGERLALEGLFSVHRLSWRREILERLSFSSSPDYESSEEPDFFDPLTLNIRFKADDDAWMENELGRVRGRFDLTVTGSVKDPIVLGEIEALGGEIHFQDRQFKVLTGRVSFFNPQATEPYLDFKGETYVKDYRVAFSLSGLATQLRPEFSSAPPLPPEDILALLAVGESFKRTYSYDASTRLSTASFLSFQLAEEAQKRAEKIFSLDRFRIDPFILGYSTEFTARLTVGKKVSKNLFILYSTNLTTQREEIVRLEWELGDNLSFVGVRDEIGRLSFDIKIRKRF